MPNKLYNIDGAVHSKANLSAAIAQFETAGKSMIPQQNPPSAFVTLIQKWCSSRR